MNTLSQIVGWIALGWAASTMCVVIGELLFGPSGKENYLRDIAIGANGTFFIVAATCAMWLLR